MSKHRRLLRSLGYLCGTLLLFTLTTLASPGANHPPAPPPSEAVAQAEAEDEALPVAEAEASAGGDVLAAAPPPAAGKPAYDELTVSERLQSGLPTALPAILPYYGERTVYLTFDDGPDPEITPAILGILRSEGVKATFFVVGSQAEKAPAILREVYREGHAIGNHSYSHVYRELYRSPAAYLGQLAHTDYIIKSVLGVRPLISRAPGGSAGSFTAAYWAALKEAGYIEVGWNIYSGDASRAKAADLVAAVADQVATRPFLWSHAIVLMHDGVGHEETVKALPAIIQIFKDRGFEFRVVNLETPPAW
jgi:peptidoglycan/xylan/chitin deacetylase (PgdA/CDA1 family)